MSALSRHCARYGALQPDDVLKFLHQSTFGCGHLVTHPSAAEAYLAQELALGTGERDIEPLDGDYCRVHLGYLRNLGVSPHSFAALFALSAAMPVGDTAALEGRIEEAMALARGGALPFSAETLAAAVEVWRREGFGPQHHSPAFRESYAPAYRVLHRDHARLLPLLGLLDRLLAERARVILAIDGGAGSGKSTLAQLLTTVYGCSVLHMDDFFLQPHQRTAERLATPGGNVDYERFFEEVLQPLREGRDFLYRPFDCGAMALTEGTTVTPAPLTVVEGSYSLHPRLRAMYDGAVFLRIDEATQRRRILTRNGPLAHRFFTEWIPLEETYFAQCGVEAACDLILEVT